MRNHSSSKRNPLSESQLKTVVNYHAQNAFQKRLDAELASKSAKIKEMSANLVDSILSRHDFDEQSLYEERRKNDKKDGVGKLVSPDKERRKESEADWRRSHLKNVWWKTERKLGLSRLKQVHEEARAERRKEHALELKKKEEDLERCKQVILRAGIILANRQYVQLAALIKSHVEIFFLRDTVDDLQSSLSDLRLAHQKTKISSQKEAIRQITKFIREELAKRGYEASNETA